MAAMLTSSRLGLQQAPPYLGAECCLFVEIAVHELTELAGGDLTAAGQGGKGIRQSPEGPCPLAGRGAPLWGP